MNSSVLFLARMLMIEQRYQAIKKSAKYTSEVDEKTTRKKLGN